MANARVERDHAALRESGEDDAPRVDATRLLARDERPRCAPAVSPHAGDIGAIRDVAGRQVVPRAHPEPVVERHRPHRSMRKDEAYRQRHGSRISLTIGTKSLPSAPRPCNQMTAAAGYGPVSSSMDGRSSAVMGISRQWRAAHFTGAARPPADRQRGADFKPPRVPSPARLGTATGGASSAGFVQNTISVNHLVRICVYAACMDSLDNPWSEPRSSDRSASAR